MKGRSDGHKRYVQNAKISAYGNFDYSGAMPLKERDVAFFTK